MFSFLFLLDWVGLRKMIFALWLLGGMGTREDYRGRWLILKASPGWGWVLVRNSTVVSVTACE